MQTVEGIDSWTQSEITEERKKGGENVRYLLLALHIFIPVLQRI